jgi:rare lipoprotein A
MVQATWYGDEFRGSRTASGEVFNPEGLTAAHKSLPFRTCLLVSNPRTGKTVVVRVNDRGPFTEGMTLDLSSGAARVIGMRSTQKVSLLALSGHRCPRGRCLLGRAKRRFSALPD